jgi:hypothetical protein
MDEEKDNEDNEGNDNTSINNCCDDDNGSENSIVISIGDMEDDMEEFDESQDNSIDLLVNEMKQTKLEPNMCVRCGSNGHYAKDCYASHDINNELIIDDIDNSFYEN